MEKKAEDEVHSMSESLVELKLSENIEEEEREKLLKGPNGGSSLDSSIKSPEVKTLIQPDPRSISKLLDFDSSEESSDEFLSSDKMSSILINEERSPNPDTSFSSQDVFYQPNKEQMHSTLKKELYKSGCHQNPAEDSANFSLEEIAHIRSVHARADIEELPDEGSTKKNIIEGKLCFQCMKTKFGLFSRSKTCALCDQAVCSKCLAKVSVTQSLLLPVEEKRQRSSTLPRLNSSVTRTPTSNLGFSRRGSVRKTSGSPISSNRGALISVCLDCKDMVLQLIRTGQTARKIEAARSMMLASILGDKKIPLTKKEDV